MGSQKFCKSEISLDIGTAICRKGRNLQKRASRLAAEQGGPEGCRKGQAHVKLFSLSAEVGNRYFINGSGRRQLAHGTTDEKSSSKVPRDRKYMHRKASRKTHSTNGLNIESRVT